MTQMTSTDGVQGVAVLGLPGLARALADAGLHVVTGDTFRAAASAANTALKTSPIPVVMADIAVAGTSPWVEKVVRTCPAVFVAVDLSEGQKRVGGNTTTAARLPAPISVDAILEAVGLPRLGVDAQVLADGSVAGDATVAPATAPQVAEPAYRDGPVNVATAAPRTAPPEPVAPVDPERSELDDFTFGQQATPATLPTPAPLPAPAVAAGPTTGPTAVLEPTPTPAAPAFDFWGAAPPTPVLPDTGQVTPVPVVEQMTPPAPVVDLWADQPAPQPPAQPNPDPAPWDQQPTPVQPDPAPWAPPPVDFPAPTHQFGVPDQPLVPAAHPHPGDQPAPTLAPQEPAPVVTPLPPVPQVPVPPIGAPLDRVPPVPAATPAQPTWQQHAVVAEPGHTQRPVVIGEQIGVETGYSPTLGRQLAPCVFTLAGKGGVGKTSIALAIAQRAAVIGGLRTVLVDGNRGQGDLRTYLSLTRSGLPTIYDAVTTGDPAAPIVTPDRLNANRPDDAEELAIALVQAPPRGLTDTTTITSALYHDVITAARGAADLVVVDTQIVEGAERGMFDELIIPMLAAHAYGVGIADLSRPGVDNLIAHLAEFIAQGVPVERLMTMLNRVPATTEFDLQRTSDALSRYGPFLAAVPADPDVHSAMAYGTSIQDNPALAPVLDQILMRVTANPVFAQSRYATTPTTGEVGAPKKRGLFRRGRG